MRERDQSARINTSMQRAGISLTQKFTHQSWGSWGGFCSVEFETVPYPACAVPTSVGGSAEPLGHF